MKRRELLKLLTLNSSVPLLAQGQLFRAGSRPTMTFQTTHTTGFSPSYTKTGATLLWQWPDGTTTSSNAPTKNLAAGTKTVRVSSTDGFKLVTVFNSPSLNFAGTLPSFAACTSLVNFSCYSNSFSGTLPSFATCTSLAYFYCGTNSFSGTLPSFATCTSLVYFYCHVNSFSGTLPSFAACTSLVEFNCHVNSFSGTLPSFAACTSLVKFYCGWGNSFSDVVAGSFATQKSLATAHFASNALPSAAVNQLLADFVASLGGGRVVCTVDVSGGTNGAPTGQGITDHDTLIAAGWTITHT